MMSHLRALPITAITLTVASAGAQQPASRPARMPIFQRLSAPQLEQFERDHAALAAKVKPVRAPYAFVRGVFHLHSHLSHDSTGQIPEIVAAAKATRTRIVGLTEHPRQDIDVIEKNVKGWIDDVYFLAGTEGGHALYWPGREGEADLRFVSHVEEVPEFDRAGFDGMEIYNTHSDAKDEPIKKLLGAIILNLAAVQAHHSAAFAAFLDCPADFLARYDKLTLQAPFAGLAANDSHRNQGIKLTAQPDGTVQAIDVSGDVIWSAEGFQAALLMSSYGQKGKPAQPVTLTEMVLDTYEVSFRHVGTFLQVDKVSEKTIRHALRTGRIILGFELVAPMPSIGFWIEHDGKHLGTVGDRIPWKPGLTLRCALPIDADLRVLRNGQVERQVHADAITWENLPDGVYRIEADQTLANQSWPWVISNPIYVPKSE